MGSRHGPSWLSFGKVFGHLYRTDNSGRQIARYAHLDPKTTFRTLRPLYDSGLVEKIHTGERNKVVYHLPPKNYWKALEFLTAKLEWPKKLPRKVQEFHRKAADMNDNVLKLLDQIPLTTEARAYLAKHYLVIQGWTGQRRLESHLQSLREGSLCLNCLNEGRGFQSTIFDPKVRVYVCQECASEQELQEDGMRTRTYSTRKAF